MSFSSMKSFNDGNFDNIYKSTKAVLDKINTLVRTKLIPSLDKALDNMLDFNGDGSKDSINIQYSVDDDYLLKDVKVCLQYTVKDFNVPLAPKSAVEEDCNTIKEYLEKNGLTVECISIDPDSGKLNLTIDVDNQEEKTNDKA